MRQPASALRQPAGRQQVTRVVAVPAPVGGWNARDPLAAMAPTDAVSLENWFPRVSDCTIRGGSADHVTGFAARPKTLATYNPPTGTNKMFAATDAGVFDVTSAGAVGASVAARTAGYHVWLDMGVSGGTFLMMFNGVDKPLYYDGATWTAVDAVSTPAITGVTTTGLVSATVFKRRLFFIENNKLSFWYLTAADAVGGAASEFLLGPLCSRGGYLMAMGSWTFDGGTGPDDFAIYVTSEGEVIMFKGTDPGNSTLWTLVGVFQLTAKPIGRKCLAKFGGDLIIVTEFGALPLSKVIQTAAIEQTQAISSKIANAFIEAARSYGGNQGWESIIYPAQNAFLFNIPVTANATYQQYVMNTITKNWCKFSGWNASCFALFNKELYFADATKISKAWTGRADSGANVVADAETAFNYFGRATQAKHWKLFRPQLLTDGDLTFSLGLAIDFQIVPNLSTATYAVTSGARWDVDLWDVGMWAAGLEIHQAWQTPAAQMGYAAAGLLRIATNALEVQWVSSEYVFEEGGVLG